MIEPVWDGEEVGMLSIPYRLCASLQPGDDRVGHLRGADRGRIVAVRLHIVGDILAFGDHRGYRTFQAVGGAIILAGIWVARPRGKVEAG